MKQSLPPFDSRCMPDEHFGSRVANQLFVFHLVQAFGDPQVEQDLLPVLEDFFERSGVRAVCTESAFGPIDINANRQLWAGVSRDDALKLMATGRLNALDFIVLFGDFDFTLWGVDHAVSYERANEIIADHRDEIESWERLISTGESPDESLLGALRQNGIETEELREFLAETEELNAQATLRRATKHDVPLTNILRGLLRASELETEIDFDKANEEVVAVMHDISVMLSDRRVFLQRSLEQVMPELKSFSAGHLPEARPETLDALRSTPAGRLIHWYLRRPETDVRPEASLLDVYDDAFDALRIEMQLNADAWNSSYIDGSSGLEMRAHWDTQAQSRLRKLWSFFGDLLPLVGRGPDSCPHTIRYGQYFQFAQLTEVFEAVEDLLSLRQRTAEALCRTDRDRASLRLVEQLGFLERLLAFKLVPIEATHMERLYDASGSFRVEEFTAAVRQVLGDHPVVHRLELLADALDRAIRRCIEWYELHVIRADTMAQKTIESMRYHGEKHVLLITGGYHREAIDRIFRNAGCAFATYTAPVRRELPPDDRKIYLGRMGRPRES